MYHFSLVLSLRSQKIGASQDLVEKLQCKKFCNVFRELDRCSRWVYRWRNLSESCLFLNIYLLRFVAVTDVPCWEGGYVFLLLVRFSWGVLS